MHSLRDSGVFQELKCGDNFEYILEKDFFGILMHMSPDGDALGSAFSLCRALQSIKKHAKILCSDPVPEKFSYMKEFIKPEDFNPQCLISVDVADRKLLGEKLKSFEDNGYKNLPICIAKTQNSISHDPKMLCAPEDFIFPIKDVQLYAGAGFVVALAGDIMTMPGLPKSPAALEIDVDDNGVISGLF